MLIEISEGLRVPEASFNMMPDSYRDLLGLCTGCRRVEAPVALPGGRRRLCSVWRRSQNL